MCRIASYYCVGQSKIFLAKKAIGNSIAVRFYASKTNRYRALPSSNSTRALFASFMGTFIFHVLTFFSSNSFSIFLIPSGPPMRLPLIPARLPMRENTAHLSAKLSKPHGSSNMLTVECRYHILGCADLHVLASQS